MEELQHQADAVGRLSNDRLGELQQAVPLINDFNETHGDLTDWFAEFEQEVDKEDIGSMSVEQMKDEQQRMRVSEFENYCYQVKQT